jgi:hypothetical protein
MTLVYPTKSGYWFAPKMVEAKKRKLTAGRNAPGSKRRRFVAKIKEQRVAEKTFSFNAPVAPQRLPPSQPSKSEATSATVPEWMRNGIASLQSSPTVLGRLFGSCFFRASRLGSASAAPNESAQRVLMRLLLAVVRAERTTAAGDSTAAPNNSSNKSSSSSSSSSSNGGPAVHWCTFDTSTADPNDDNGTAASALLAALVAVAESAGALARLAVATAARSGHDGGALATLDAFLAELRRRRLPASKAAVAALNSVQLLRAKAAGFYEAELKLLRHGLVRLQQQQQQPDGRGDAASELARAMAKRAQLQQQEQEQGSVTAASAPAPLPLLLLPSEIPLHRRCSEVVSSCMRRQLRKLLNPPGRTRKKEGIADDAGAAAVAAEQASGTAEQAAVAPLSGISRCKPGAAGADGAGGASVPLLPALRFNGDDSAALVYIALRELGDSENRGSDAGAASHLSFASAHLFLRRLLHLSAPHFDAQQQQQQQPMAAVAVAAAWADLASTASLLHRLQCADEAFLSRLADPAALLQKLMEEAPAVESMAKAATAEVRLRKKLGGEQRRLGAGDKNAQEIEFRVPRFPALALANAN